MTKAAQPTEAGPDELTIPAGNPLAVNDSEAPGPASDPDDEPTEAELVASYELPPLDPAGVISAAFPEADGDLDPVAAAAALAGSVGSLYVDPEADQ